MWGKVMRGRLKKKTEGKRLAAEMKLFKIKKALAIAELVVNTYQALSALTLKALPSPVLALQSFHIRNNFEIQKMQIVSTTFKEWPID